MPHILGAFWQRQSSQLMLATGIEQAQFDPGSTAGIDGKIDAVSGPCCTQRLR